MNNMNQQLIENSLSLRAWNMGDLALKARIVEALAKGENRYPIHRELHLGARMELEALFDTLALHGAWKAQRVYATRMLLDAENVFIMANGAHKLDYCSCYFEIWAADIKAAEQARSQILEVVGAKRITEPMFSIDWYFLTGGGQLENASIEEMANDVLIDEAYPEFPGGVNAFIDRYLDAEETVLVLQGPPGTGKTRLVRAILGRMSRRKGNNANALYTGDKKTLENDEIFVKFITGWDDAFVIEDADHVLRPRTDGNDHLHRFLTVADGVVRSQGRKIIFSTNLPNVGDLDEALIRPGRCFARAFVRMLTPAEAEKLVRVLVPDPCRAEKVAIALDEMGKRSISLAEVYGAIRAQNALAVATN